MKGIQRFISGWLAVCMVLSMLPMQAFASETEPTEETIAAEAVSEETVTETTMPTEPPLAPTEADPEPTEESTIPAETVAEPTVETVALSQVSEEAMNADTTASGTCGENLTWEFDEASGILRISGTGDMYDYDFGDNPWYAFTTETIIIEPGVTNIGQYAFSKSPECTISSISIPDTVTRFEDLAFYYIHGLAEIYIPSSLEYIGEYVFSEIRLERITVSPDNTYFCNDSSGALLTIDGSELIRLPMCYKGEYAVPDGVRKIRGHAFQGCSGMTEITIPDTVTDIGELAFYWCMGLKEIVLPSGMVKISNALFSMCENIDKIVLPDTLTTIGDAGFHGCASLNEIIIPENVTYIGERPFGYCENLRHITFTGDAPVFHENAFKYLETCVMYPVNNITWTSDMMQDYGGDVTWVSYGDPVTSGTCGDNLIWSFDIDTDTLTISGIGDMNDCRNGNMPWVEYQDQIKCVVIEEGVTSVGEMAFYDCTALTTVTVPGSVTSIARDAFGGNNSLQSITVDAENKDYASVIGILFNKDKTILIQYPCQKDGTYYSIPDTVIEIAPRAFKECSKLSSVGFPDSLKTIGESAFWGCVGLNQIRIPDSVTKIDTSAFQECSNLKFVEIGEGITDLGIYVFESCSSLEEVILPDALVNIWEGTFCNCTSLKSLRLPAGMNFVSDAAFAYCTALEEITFDGIEEIWRPFGNCTALKKVTFMGDAPSYCTDAFRSLTLNAYYPAGNATWTDAVRKSFGGNITWIATDNTYEFTDVPENAYYYDSVMWAVKKKITNGVGDGTIFAPDSDCTRGQIVTFLWRAAGSPEPASSAMSFDDVEESDFYYKAVLWAVENGITNGYGGADTFAPNVTCTRGQVVTMLSRYLNGKPSNDNNPFVDVVEGAFYYDAVLWAAENGITTGTSEHTFEPEAVCTRGQIVTFLYRALYQHR